MPVRHEGDFQRKAIKSWDSWVEEEIQKSNERGEFDDLPDHGKPIKLEDTPFAPDMASPLRTLKNAGFEPTWMELDRKITHGKQELDAFLSQSIAYLDRLSDQAAADPHPLVAAPAPPRGRWQRFARWLTFADDTEAIAPAAIALEDVARIRATMRAQYLERAAAVDKTISEFHAALPRNLWHLERMRLTPEAAAKAFDTACPPIPDGQV